MIIMFIECSSLVSLNLSNFFTSNVIHMKDIFTCLNENSKIITNDKMLKILKF